MRTILLFIYLFFSIAKAATFTHEETNLHFPECLSSWKQTKVTKFPEKNLGVEIDYSGPNKAVASFYVYMGGIDKIPTGSENAVVQKEFSNLQKQVEGALKTKFQDVSKLLESSPEISSEQQKATLSVAAFQFSNNGHRWLSWVLITGYKSHFLKLRYTQCFDKDGDIELGQKMLKDIVTAFIDKNDDNAEAFWQKH